MSKEKLFHDYKMNEFDFEDTTGIVVFPNENSNGKIAFKTEYWDAYPELEIELIKRGFHLVHVKNKTRLANKEDCKTKARFIEYVSNKFSFDKRCIMVGMSCGGAQAVNFAGYYPEYAGLLVLDAPVLNFLDFPARYNEYESVYEEEFKVAYPGIKRPDIFKLDENPINRASKLIEEKIPIIMLYGTEDKTVEYSQNGRLLEEAYCDNKDLLTIIPRNWQGHHPHGLLDKSNELAELVLSKL